MITFQAKNGIVQKHCINQLIHSCGKHENNDFLYCTGNINNNLEIFTYDTTLFTIIYAIHNNFNQTFLHNLDTAYVTA